MPSYGTLPSVAQEDAPPRFMKLGLSLGLAGLCVAAVAVGTQPLGLTTASLDGVQQDGDVCLVHVAAGDEFLDVSAYTFPGKEAYANDHGYRLLHYADAPTCCDGSASYACSLTNVAYKYCAIQDAMLTGGAHAEGGNAAGSTCAWVFATDGDAVFVPDSPALDGLVPSGDLKNSDTKLVISAGSDYVTTDVTTDVLEENFNSGAMLWQNTADARSLVRTILDFSDKTYDGTSGTACNCATVGGCGDQWALCGATYDDNSLFEGVVALEHPAQLQRALLFNNGAIVPIRELDWPPQAGEEAFVVNCAGNDPLGCVRFMAQVYYPDMEDPRPTLKDALDTSMKDYSTMAHDGLPPAQKQ